ncbi:hypothetical protein ACJJTC_016227 [Scirpophaga incertulas]
MILITYQYHQSPPLTNPVATAPVLDQNPVASSSSSKRIIRPTRVSAKELEIKSDSGQPDVFALHFARFGPTSVCGGRRGDNGERARAEPNDTPRERVHVAMRRRHARSAAAISCLLLITSIVPGNDKKKEEVIPLRGKYLPILSHLSLFTPAIYLSKVLPRGPGCFALHFARFGPTSVCGGRRGDNGERARAEPTDTPRERVHVAIAALPDKEEHQIDEDIAIHVNLFMSTLSITSTKLDEIKNATSQDHTLQLLKKYCLEGWPKSKFKTIDSVKPYWNFQAEITVMNNLLFKNSAIIIPQSMRKEMLRRVHSGHLGRYIVFTDESYIHTTHMQNKCWKRAKGVSPFQKQLSKGMRVIIVHAGGSRGSHEP